MVELEEAVGEVVDALSVDFTFIAGNIDDGNYMYEGGLLHVLFRDDVVDTLFDSFYVFCCSCSGEPTKGVS